jgi:hypothetical protein
MNNVGRFVIVAVKGYLTLNVLLLAGCLSPLAYTGRSSNMTNPPTTYQSMIPASPFGSYRLTKTG